MKPLRFDPQARFACQSCGRCCRGPWLVEVGEDDRARLEVADIPGAPKRPWFTAARDPATGETAHRFARQACGACVFLDEENRCRMHAPLGLEGKALVCRSFPYTFHEGAREVFVGLSAACPTVAAQQGPPLSKDRRMLESLAREVLARAEGGEDFRRSVRGDEDRLADWAQEAVDDGLRGFFAQEENDLAGSSWRALRFLRELGDFELAPLSERELHGEIERAQGVACGEWRHTAPLTIALTARERRELRGWCAHVLFPVSADDYLAPSLGRWRARLGRSLCVLRAMLGSAPVPDSAARIRLAPATHRPLDDAARERLRDYLAAKLHSRQYRGGWRISLLEAFNGLLLHAAIAALAAGALAVHAGCEAVTREHLQHALVLVEGSYGHVKGQDAVLRLPLFRSNTPLKFLVFALGFQGA